MMLRDPFRFYQVPPPAPTYFGGTFPAVNVRASYPDDYVANAVRRGGSKFLGTTLGFMGQPQRDMVELFTGVEQTPSEALGITNPVGSFLTDAILDPLNIGPTMLAKGMVLGGLRSFPRIGFSGIAKRGAKDGVPIYGDFVDNSLTITGDVNRFNGGVPAEETQRAIDEFSNFLANQGVVDAESARSVAEDLTEKFSKSKYNQLKADMMYQQYLRKQFKKNIAMLQSKGVKIDLNGNILDDLVGNETRVPMSTPPVNFLSETINAPKGTALASARDYMSRYPDEVAGTYIWSPISGNDAIVLRNDYVKKSSPATIFGTIFHEKGHARTKRLMDIAGSDGLPIKSATPEEKSIMSRAWRNLLKDSNGNKNLNEMESSQHELRMMLRDFDGSRVYTEKDIPEIKTAMAALIENNSLLGSEYYAFWKGKTDTKAFDNDINWKAMVNSLNKIGFAGFTGATLAPSISEYYNSRNPNADFSIGNIYNPRRIQ